MKRILLIFSPLLFSIISCKTSGNDSDNGYNILINQAVVKIEVTSISGGISMGTGFVIDSHGFVVTNDHVLGDVKNITIRTENNITFHDKDIGIIYRSELQDIAILLVKNLTIPPIPMAIGSGNAEGEVQIVGFPLGENQRTTTGTISSQGEIIMDEFSYIPISSNLTQGFSGSPVVNSTGKAIGVATRVQGRGMSYAVPIRYVRSVIERSYQLLNQENLIQTGSLLFDDNVDMTKISGQWNYYGNFLYHIPYITQPFQLGVFGLVVADPLCSNFVLEAQMKSITRFDGYRNVDVGIVFRYQDPQNFYAFTTFSGEKEVDYLPLYKQDKGALWRVRNGNWEIIQKSRLVQEFQDSRWYRVKIAAAGPQIRVFVDNVKCIDVEDRTFSSGKVGFRTTSSHSWFYGLKVYSF